MHEPKLAIFMSDDIAIAMYPVDGPFNVNIIISVPLDVTGFHCTEAQLVPHGSGTFQLPPIFSSGMLSVKHNATFRLEPHLRC